MTGQYGKEDVIFQMYHKVYKKQ